MRRSACHLRSLTSETGQSGGHARRLSGRAPGVVRKVPLRRGRDRGSVHPQDALGQTRRMGKSRYFERRAYVEISWLRTSAGQMYQDDSSRADLGRSGRTRIDRGHLSRKKCPSCGGGLVSRIDRPNQGSTNLRGRDLRPTAGRGRRDGGPSRSETVRGGTRKRLGGSRHSSEKSGSRPTEKSSGWGNQCCPGNSNVVERPGGRRNGWRAAARSCRSAVGKENGGALAVDRRSPKQGARAKIVFRRKKNAIADRTRKKVGSNRRRVEGKSAAARGIISAAADPRQFLRVFTGD